ncbi:MAG: tRNA (adenosine(37)-N6)-dimethylallyltransferase MiaA [Pseudomonadota bacterium]
MVEQIIAVLGPTASGKSKLAATIAQALGGWVINADSMQIYQGLPILTAQPDGLLQQLAPHHLFATHHASIASSAGLWRNDVYQSLAAARAQAAIPILCGGTGLYFKALTEGLAQIPRISPEIRQQLHHELATFGIEAMRAKLARLDPDHLHYGSDPQRVLRALEVYLATGKSLLTWQEQHQDQLGCQNKAHPIKLLVILLLPPREQLYQRINARVIQMVHDGVMEEVGAVMRCMGSEVWPITNALGFVPLQRYLQGHHDLEFAIQQTQTLTRRYAKRQMTWLRHQKSPAFAITARLEAPPESKAFNLLIETLRTCLHVSL